VTFCLRIVMLFLCVLMSGSHGIDAKQTAKQSAATFDQIMEQARLYKRTRQNLLALDAYQKALKLRPNNSEAHASLGWTLYDLRMVDEGIEELDKALKLNPKNAMAHHHLAVIYMMLGRLPEAADEYRAEYAIDPRRNCNCGPSNALLMSFPPGYSEMMRIRDEVEAKGAKRAGTPAKSAKTATKENSRARLAEPPETSGLSKENSRARLAEPPKKPATNPALPIQTR
jgi:tetratricopeptide (TPR) repeat protein